MTLSLTFFRYNCFVVVSLHAPPFSLRYQKYNLKRYIHFFPEEEKIRIVTKIFRYFQLKSIENSIKSLEKFFVFWKLFWPTGNVLVIYNFSDHQNNLFEEWKVRTDFVTEYLYRFHWNNFKVPIAISMIWHLFQKRPDEFGWTVLR